MRKLSTTQTQALKSLVNATLNDVPGEAVVNGYPGMPTFQALERRGLVKIRAMNPERFWSRWIVTLTEAGRAASGVQAADERLDEEIPEE